MSSTPIRSGQLLSHVARERRHLLALAACAPAAPFNALAQPAGKIRRIGFLAIGAGQALNQPVCPTRPAE